MFQMFSKHSLKLCNLKLCKVGSVCMLNIPHTVGSDCHNCDVINQFLSHNFTKFLNSYEI